MKFDFKKMYISTVCAVVGILGFLFLSFDYVSVFYDFGDQSKSVSFNGYEAIGNSISEALNKIYETFRISENAPSLLAVLSILQIAILVLSIALLIVGALGLAKEYIDYKLLNKLNADKIKKLSRYLLSTYCKFLLISVIGYLVSCLFASYTGSVLGTSITLGIKPNLELFVIGVLAIVIQIFFKRIEKKYAATTDNLKSEENSSNETKEAEN